MIAREPAQAVPPFPIRSLVACLTVTVLLLAALGWHLWASYRGIQSTLGEDFNIQRLSGVVVHLDEVLTMSARMAAATGDLAWEKRYRAYEPELDSAIKEVMRLASEALMKDAAGQTDSANLRLVEMENKAFDLIRQGRRDEAMAILAGREYKDQKQLYARGMKEITAALQNRTAASLRSRRRDLYVGFASGLAGLPVVALIWFVVLRGAKRHIAERRRAEAELEKHREHLAELVEERTAQLTIANQEVARQVAALARSNAELEEFAYVASHDLQEPLRKILAFGDRLRAACAEGLPGQGGDYLERMLNAARRMHTLINDLLTFSRVTTQARPHVPVDLNEVLREVLSDLEVRMEQTGAQVDAGALPTVQADPTQMRQLFQNLIGNALKFRRAEQNPQIRIRAESADGMHRITVEDNGIGFEDKYAERIFGIFQRLHGRGEYEGTGIGLAVCQKIVHRHGGRIAAKGEPGRGSTFIVSLPIEHRGSAT